MSNKISKLYTFNILLIFTLAICLAFFRGTEFENLELGHGITDSYWSSFWIINYNDGYLRRALIGSIFTFFFSSGVNIFILNIFQFFITICLLSLISSQIFKLLKEYLSFNYLIFIITIFLASPVSAGLFETAGDPLQTSILIYLVVNLILSNNNPMKVLILILVIFISSAIHEISIFYTIPHLIFTNKYFAKKTSLYKIFLSIFITTLITIIIVFLFNETNGTSDFFLTGSTLNYEFKANLELTPSLFEVLKNEIFFIFEDKYSFFRFLIRVYCFAIVPFFILILIDIINNDFVGYRILRNFFFLILSSSFLYPFHDWGRWASISFLICFTINFKIQNYKEDKIFLYYKNIFKKITEKEKRLIFIYVITIILSPFIFWFDYRVQGAPISGLLSIPFFIFILLKKFRI